MKITYFLVIMFGIISMPKISQANGYSCLCNREPGLEEPKIEVRQVKGMWTWGYRFNGIADGGSLFHSAVEAEAEASATCREMFAGVFSCKHETFNYCKCEFAGRDLDLNVYVSLSQYQMDLSTREKKFLTSLETFRDRSLPHAIRSCEIAAKNRKFECSDL